MLVDEGVGCLFSSTDISSTLESVPISVTIRTESQPSNIGKLNGILVMLEYDINRINDIYGAQLLTAAILNVPLSFNYSNLTQ